MRARHRLGSIVVAVLATASGCSSPAGPAGPVVPAGPSNLAAVAVDRSTVRLTWSDNSTDEAGFTVEHAFAASGPWQAAATTGPGIITVDVTSLAAGTTHHFRVRAFNDAGASEWTPVASATTPSPEPVVRGLLFAPPVVHRNSAGLRASMPSGSGERYDWSVIPGTASGELVGGASGNVVQFRTGAQPGSLTLVASVTDGSGRVSTSQASVQVVGGWLFDPEPLPRSSHEAVLLPGGRVLVLGGIVGSGSTLPVDVTQVYDPETGGWAPGARLPLARSFFPAVTLSDGRVLAAGGGDQGATFTNVDIYDPDTGSWQPTGALGIARESHTATLLADGRVLVVGGTAKISSGAELSAELYDPATGTWTPAAPLPAKIGGTAVLLRDGRVLVAGGGANTLLYNPAAGTWTPAAPMARAREAHTATVLPDGKVLVVGGFGDAQPDTPYTAEVYDPATDAWTSVGPLTASRTYHAAALMADGRVLISGGFSDAGPAALASVEFYDPISGSITAGPDMSGPRVFHTATPLPDGGVLVMGGRDTGPNLASAERFDPATGAWRSAGAGAMLNPGRHTAEVLQDGSLLQSGGQAGLDFASAACNRFDPVARTWTPVADMVAARLDHASVRLADGRVLAVGGYPSNVGPPPALRSTELYDPTTGEWSAGADMLAGRSSPGVVLLQDGSVLVVGGSTDPGAPQWAPIAERWVPARGIWEEAGPLAQRRDHMTTTLLASGEVLVAGGAVGDATPDAELYSPATGTWRAAARLNGARYWHTATRLQNGRVLVTGGFGNATSLASAELYDPATDAWARVASMAVPRYWHTATLLPDGRVLVTGGSSGGGTSLHGSEVYDPVTDSWTDGGSMAFGRRGHTTTLLGTGDVLVLGGGDGSFGFYESGTPEFWRP